MDAIALGGLAGRTAAAIITFRFALAPARCAATAGARATAGVLIALALAATGRGGAARREAAPLATAGLPAGFELLAPGRAGFLVFEALDFDVAVFTDFFFLAIVHNTFCEHAAPRQAEGHLYRPLEAVTQTPDAGAITVIKVCQIDEQAGYLLAAKLVALMPVRGRHAIAFDERIRDSSERHHTRNNPSGNLTGLMRSRTSAPEDRVAHFS